jgi:NAD(P)-dependent dehydrogenase (short-subunit alcohol dehydrogenase family)
VIGDVLRCFERSSFLKSKWNYMSSNEKPVAIVTGASSGIGLGIVQALLDRGYRVVGTSRTITKSKELKPSADLVLVDGDVSKKETAVKVADAAVKDFGRIDLLVNNAGIFIRRRSLTIPKTTTIW